MRASYLKIFIFAILFLIGYEFGRVEANQANVPVDQVEQFYTESVETVEIQDDNVYGPVHLAEVVVIGDKYDDSQQTIKITVEDEREYAAEMQPIPAPTAAFAVEEVNPPSNICLT